MSKTPEEYFQEQSFSVPGRSGDSAGGFSAAELAFIRKYMGLEAPDTLRKMGLADKAQALEKEPEQLELPPQPVPSVVSGLLGDADAPVPPLARTQTPPSESGAYAVPDGATPMDSLQMTLDRTMPDRALPDQALTGQAGVGRVLLEQDGVDVDGVDAQEPAQAEVAELVVPEPAEPTESTESPELTEAAETIDTVELEALPLEAEPVERPALTEPSELVEPVAESVTTAAPEQRAAVVQAAAPLAEAPTHAQYNIADNYDEDLLDNSDLATYRETTRQQFHTIKLALEGLRKDGGDMPLADAIYRSLVTVQNSSNYMGLDEIKVYAERTAGLVDQGRKSGMDFSLMVDLISQESAILSDMVGLAVAKLAAAPEAAGATVAEPVAVLSQSAPTVTVAQPQPEAPVEAVTAAEPPSAPVRPEPVAPAPEQPAAPVPLAEKIERPKEVGEKPGISKAVDKPVDKGAGKPRTASIAEIYEGMDIQDALEHYLRNEPELQMVAFYLGSQEFTVPTVIVQEVIHYSEPAKLPVAPPFVAGVINLRGKVTPLVYLRDILEVKQERKTEDCFIIICRFQGLQVGLIIERVHTMYRVPQSDIDWGIEQHLGINVDYVSGLLKLGEHLVGIVSVDRIVTNLLQDL